MYDFLHKCRFINIKIFLLLRDFIFTYLIHNLLFLNICFPNCFSSISLLYILFLFLMFFFTFHFLPNFQFFLIAFLLFNHAAHPTFHRIFRHFRLWFSFSLSSSISPLWSLFFICLTRFTVFHPLLSPATLLRRSCCAHSLRLSRPLPPLKHLHARDQQGKTGGERVAYPEQLSLADFQHVDRGRNIGLDYSATDSCDCRLQSEFFYRYTIYFPLFLKIFSTNCNFGKNV